MHTATLVAALSVVLGTMGAVTGHQPKSKTHTVTIEGMRFQPEVLAVAPGDTIVWVNKDPFPHTVTAKGQFDSGSIGVDRRWTLVARKAGHYAYLCTLHPNMQGSVDVE